MLRAISVGIALALGAVAVASAQPAEPPGTWIFVPAPPTTQNTVESGWLLNTRTGELLFCGFGPAGCTRLPKVPPGKVAAFIGDGYKTDVTPSDSPRATPDPWAKYLKDPTEKPSGR